MIFDDVSTLNQFLILISGPTTYHPTYKGELFIDPKQPDLYHLSQLYYHYVFSCQILKLTYTSCCYVVYITIINTMI